jgi:serpin B
MISMQLPRQCRSPLKEEYRVRPKRELQALGRFAGAALIVLAAGRGAVAQAPDARALAEAYNASGMVLLKELSTAHGNIVLSPYSIGSAMAMVLSGARGQTEQEMARVLRQRLDGGAMEAAAAALRSTLDGYDKSSATPNCPDGLQPKGNRCEASVPPGAQCVYPAQRDGAVCVAPGQFPPSARVLTANALMLPKPGELIDPQYMALLKDKFGAEVFENVGLDDVNGFVARKTDGKIDHILDRLDPTTAAVILNAVYFKAKWATAFRPALTADEPFNLSRRQKVSVPTMHAANSYPLAVRNGYRALRLPYDVGALGMIIVLPDEVDGLDAVGRRLDAAEWTQLASALQGADATRLVDLALPRFKAGYGADLVSVFRQAGMVRAFDAKQADFSGMTGQPPSRVPLAIGSIMHRAIVDVAEDGTEAAAATAASMVAASIHRPVQTPQPLHVDRPFLFAIVDDATGAVLFEGRVADPR